MDTFNYFALSVEESSSWERNNVIPVEDKELLRQKYLVGDFATPHALIDYLTQYTLCTLLIMLGDSQVGTAKASADEAYYYFLRTSGGDFFLPHAKGMGCRVKALRTFDPESTSMYGLSSRVGYEECRSYTYLEHQIDEQGNVDRCWSNKQIADELASLIPLDCERGQSTPKKAIKDANNQWVPMGFEPCLVCPPGKFQKRVWQFLDGSGSTQTVNYCQQCPSGQYTNGKDDQDACVPCPWGQSTSSCADIGLHEFLAIYEKPLDSCCDCPTGKYGDGPHRFGDTFSRNGRFVWDGQDLLDNVLISDRNFEPDRLLECKSCPPATYSTELAVPTCQKCPRGKTSSGGDSLYCTDVEPCDRGTERDPASGENNCRPCRAGQFNALAKADNADM